MKKTLFLLLCFTMILSVSSCSNEKLEHYKSGGSLLCKKSKWFSEDEYKYVNKNNSSYQDSMSLRSYNPKEGFWQNKSWFGFGGTFFKIDDCKIK